MSSDQEVLEQLAYLFRYFGERQCHEDSPFYANLAFQIANDRELLKLASATPRGQWVQNMLFAAVHDLLLQGVQHPLRAYYPTTAASPNPANPFPVFRAFCLDYADDIRELLTTRRGQTNEIGRCALLLPAFSAVYQHAGAPLALIEVGASAGLNLLFDRYSYHYSNGQRYGAQRSPVQLKCELRGPWRPALPEQLPPVTWRVGIDLAPIDLQDRNAVRWLRALIWPDDLSRMRRLEAAIALAARKPPTVWAGDAFERLPEALAAAPRMRPSACITALC